MLGLSACTNSTPSNERMANDIIETVDGLTDDERECMRGRLDEYSGSDLDAINDENNNVDWDAEGATGGPKWQALVDDLADCRTDAAASDGSEPADTSAGDSEPDDTATDESAPDETDPASTTEPGNR